VPNSESAGHITMEGYYITTLHFCYTESKNSNCKSSKSAQVALYIPTWTIFYVRVCLLSFSSNNPSQIYDIKTRINYEHRPAHLASQQKMCRSYTIVYTNCGHSVHHPHLCEVAQQRRPISACRGWTNPMRETFQGEDEDCPACQDTRILRITQQPWTNRNNGDDVPIRLRRDSLSQRYVPTPPPIYTSRFEYGSGYGYAEDERRREIDPDPSPREVRRRIADWADHVPAPQVSGSANTTREMQLYRPREQDRFRRAEGSSSHHSGVESHTSPSSRRRSDIYDLRRSMHRQPRSEDSSQSSHYFRASDEERRSRYGYPPSLPSAASTHDSYALSETRISVNAAGTEVTRTSTWRLEYQQQDQPDHTEDSRNTAEQSRQAGVDYDSSVRRGQDVHNGSGDMSCIRGPHSPLSPSQRRIH
jgi:hypothetical protein